MRKNLKYCVIGSGSWATAIIKILSENLKEINWYVRNKDNVEYIYKNCHNPNYLSSVELDIKKIYINDDINEVCNKSDVLIIAVPSEFINNILNKISINISDKIVVSAIKGIVPETNLLVGDHLEKNFQIKENNFSVLGGPCHAEEVALEKLSYLTIGSSNKMLAKKIASKFTCSYISAQTSDDVIGIEYSSMLKNIYAIAAGIAHGIGYGDNFQSVLMSSSIKEMNRFIEKRYLMKRDINDSVYLGDLLVTGYSLFSRNRLFGNMIGKGYSVKYAKMEMSMIAEGYVATKKAYLLNSESNKKAKIPIIESVYNILYLKRSPKKTFKNLCEKIN
ncbi:MAG: NAD(P)-binding domain-containing protein [Pelagibacterales bacterium]|jgi:glycerol-3-phosphate dehydrogenase (NAD(P)+)|nr:NAD(P)-binding domain-containing protein [Pelagibacterales bacterium]